MLKTDTVISAQIKTKLIAFFQQKQKILLSWAFFMTASFAALGIGAILSSNISADNQKPLLPDPQGQVLGETTQLRGQAEVSAPKAELPAADTERLKSISAKSFLVYWQENGQALVGKNQDERLPIASLTKLMTALLAYENLDLSQSVTVDAQTLTKIRPVVGFVDGDKVRLSDVFDAAIVGSCNDAAQLLALEVGKATKQDPVALMNAKAQQLGMTNTHFSNPLGFDYGENYSTANDLEKLVNATQNLAAFSNLGLKTFIKFSGSLKNYYIRATNKLIGKYDGIEAIKTGYTETAQGAMITKMTSHGKDLIVIVLGSDNRELDTLALKKDVIDNLVWN
ncbi:MAG: D-alanyl-D-alanine carboxypeptidase [Patescibacteria group bacterium]|nr:D-alanyl-D-alanine carboxypeptidase [Patescibacteria group bacterium]